MSPARKKKPKARSAPKRPKKSSARKPLDQRERMDRLDPDGMGSRIEGFSAQLRAGGIIAAETIRHIDPHRPRRLVILGMGGSAIAGDLLRNLSDREGVVPVHVVRHYEPPSWLTPEDFLVFSSYSGETEETITAYRALRQLGARSAVLATGGTLVARARADGVPVALMPPGLPPRSALGYSFSTLSHIAHHVGVLADAGRRLERAAEAVERAASAWSRDVIQSRNSAKKLAIRLFGRPILLIANQRTAEPVALRWKGQLNENSKQLAWVSALPEMNHNEVDGFVHPRGIVGRIAVVLIRDPEDHPRIVRRFDWLMAYLKRRRVLVETVTLEGDDPMVRLLWGVARGDFVSYYLAILNGEDPSALPGVTALKGALQT